jgi:hypothetical protein
VPRRTQDIKQETPTRKQEPEAEYLGRH